MTVTLLPESEGAVREWVHTLSDIEAIVGSTGVYFRLPQTDDPPKNCIVITRFGGTPDEFGKDRPQIHFTCFGKNKYDASKLARLMCQHIEELVYDGNRATTSGVIEASSGVDIGPRPMDPQPDWARRYEVVATFSIRAM